MEARTHRKDRTSRSSGPPPHVPVLRNCILPFASGALLVFAYPPFSVPILPFVGLVPLFLWLGRKKSGREVHWGGWAFAIPYFVGNLYGFLLISRFTLAGLPGVLGILVLHWATFFIVPIVLNVLNFTTGIPLPLAAPFVWVVSEHARTYGDLYFPWVTLGYSLSDWPILVQHADLVGVYGISAWLVFVNALIAEMLRGRRRSVGRALCAGLLAISVLAPVAYGLARWRQVERLAARAPRLTVAIAQPDVRQAMKWDPDSAAAVFAQVNRSIASAEASRPDLVVGPEACLPMVMGASEKRLPEEIGPGTVPLLIGVVTGIGEGESRQSGAHTITLYREHFNSAVLAAADRTVLGRHDKQVLVPVAEQIPYKGVFGFLLPFMRKQFGRFVKADHLNLLELPVGEREVPFGALICYESLFPRLVRRMSTMGAEFLVNITNDAWFGRTTFPYQHAGFCVLRAIENRRAIVRCANTGISAFYDPLGRSSKRTELFRGTTESGTIPLMTGLTVYDRLGDAAVFASYAMFAAFVFLAWRGRSRALVAPEPSGAGA